MAAGEPPSHVVYDLEEALELLAAMEDAHEALVDSDHLAVVVQMEEQIAALNHKLGFDHPYGGGDGH